MCKTKLLKLRLSASLFLSALVGLSLLVLQSAEAATVSDCVPELGGGVTLNKTKAHVNEIVTVNLVQVATSASTDCSISGGSMYLTLPDNTSLLVATNIALLTPGD